MVNNTLEPFWEARFEGISYAFRPGWGCYDAVEKLFRLTRTNTTQPWVIDANMEEAFYNIGHAILWSRYFCTGVASEVFTDLDNFMYARAQRYMRGGVIAISSPYPTT